MGPATSARHWQLRARDIGEGSRSTDMLVTCVKCNQNVMMTAAFGENARGLLPQCRGRHAHLRNFDDSCNEQVRPLLLGAPNTWFAGTRAVLSIPASADSVEQAVAERWPKLNSPDTPVDSLGMLKYAIVAVPELKGLGAFDLRRWSGRRSRPDGPAWPRRRAPPTCSGRNGKFREPTCGAGHTGLPTRHASPSARLPDADRHAG